MNRAEFMAYLATQGRMGRDSRFHGDGLLLELITTPPLGYTLEVGDVPLFEIMVCANAAFRRFREGREDWTILQTLTRYDGEAIPPEDHGALHYLEQVAASGIPLDTRLGALEVEDD